MDKNINERLSNIENLLLNQKTVLTFNEVAIYTGISKNYLYKLACTGGIPCYKPRTKQLYFNKAEIDNWLLRNKKKTNNEIEQKKNSSSVPHQFQETRIILLLIIIYILKIIYILLQQMYF